MSARQIAKNRFHKGLTAAVRRSMRRAGVSLDEEMAQFVLGGVTPFNGVPASLLIRVRNKVLTNRRNLASEWEARNPDRNPFAPSFPERVLKVAREALRECDAEDGSPVYDLTVLVNMCLREMETEPDTQYPLDETFD